MCQSFPSAASKTHLVTHTVEACPQCGLRHDYAVELRSVPLMFGGGGTDQVQTTADCPATGKPFETTINLPANEELVRIVTPSESGVNPEAGAPAKEAPDKGSDGLPSDEYDEWLKASRDYAIDFSKTMLTTSSGAVAVYFAVLTYLGATRAARSFGGALSIVPPVLFLSSTAVFALALRPRLASVGRVKFADFRDSRLRRLDLYISMGLSFFVVALIIAFVVYARVLRI